MRPDVKLGVVISSVFVFVAGTYYIYRDQSDRTIPVTGSAGLLAELPANEPAATPTTVDKRAARQPARRSSTGNASKLAQKKNQARMPARRGAKPSTVPGLNTRNRQAKNPAASKTRTGVPAKKAVPNQPGKNTLASRNPAGAGRKPAANNKPRDLQLAGRTSQQDIAARRAMKSGAGARKSVPLVASNPTAVPTVVTNSPASVSPSARVAVDTHRVQPGDTLSALAKRYYGNVALTGFLVKSNPQLANPDALKVGEAVRIPSRPESAKLAVRSTVKGQAVGAVVRAAKTGRVYRVQPGDSFYKIAQEVLGDAGRWKELFELNKTLVEGNPTRLRPGQQLVLPIS